MVVQRTQPTHLTLLADLRATTAADDARSYVERHAPELVAMIFGGSK